MSRSCRERACTNRCSEQSATNCRGHRTNWSPPERHPCSNLWRILISRPRSRLEPEPPIRAPRALRPHLTVPGVRLPFIVGGTTSVSFGYSTSTPARRSRRRTGRCHSAHRFPAWESPTASARCSPSRRNSLHHLDRLKRHGRGINRMAAKPMMKSMMKRLAGALFGAAAFAGAASAQIGGASSIRGRSPTRCSSSFQSTPRRSRTLIVSRTPIRSETFSALLEALNNSTQTPNGSSTAGR